jgi:hypothetical protein
MPPPRRERRNAYFVSVSIRVSIAVMKYLQGMKLSVLNHLRRRRVYINYQVYLLKFVDTPMIFTKFRVNDLSYSAIKWNSKGSFAISPFCNFKMGIK